MSKFIQAAKKQSKQSKPRWKPHAYQRKAVKFLLEHGAAALFLDPGLGKTSITLAACKTLISEGVMKGALIIAPLRPAQSTWPAELAKWADFEGLDMVVLHGKEKDKLAQEKHDIYVVNYDGLAWLFAPGLKEKGKLSTLNPVATQLLKNVDTLVFDELSKMKHVQTKRFKLLKPLLHKFQRRWGLTGSPASNGLEGLFGQCYALDQGAAFGGYKTHFMANYFLQVDPQGFNWKLKPGAEEQIQQKIKPLVLRMSSEDYLDLPERLDHTLKFELPKTVRKQYEDLEKELITKVGDSSVVAANAAGAVSKCRQVCSGALYLPEIDPVTGVGQVSGKKPWTELHTEKIGLLEELLEELQGAQVLVAYDFKHDLERLLTKFPKAEFIGGGVSGSKAVDIEQRWNKGTVELLFCHPQSAGVGLNLQGSDAHHIVWFTLTWDFELYMQFNGRLLRQGNQAELLHVYHMVAEDTVEESVLYALRHKDKTQRSLLEALKTKKRV